MSESEDISKKISDFLSPCLGDTIGDTIGRFVGFVYYIGVLLFAVIARKLSGPPK